MTEIHISDIEAAINYWRARTPSVDGVLLAAEVEPLAEVYADLVFRRHTGILPENMPAIAYAAWLAWYETTPDTPCIAICSTSQGDEQCKGCGRTFDEVQLWPEMSPAAKRHVWRRIALSAEAWRFNRYAERATEGSAA